MDRASWDDRFAKDGYLFGTRPSDFLVSQSDRLKGGGKVLAVADGEGRNGVWLAEQGLEVTSVDGSANALNKARALAADRGVALETECVDLLAWEWPQAVFDVVVSIFFHSEPLRRTRLHHAMLRAVRPGGLVIVEFREYAHDISATFAHLEQYGKLPLCYSLVARKTGQAFGY